MDKRILKVRVPKEKRNDGLPLYPYNMLHLTPPQNCIFDAYRGTIGFDIFPFAVTTRISASCDIYLKVYEDLDGSDEGEGI